MRDVELKLLVDRIKMYRYAGDMTKEAEHIETLIKMIVEKEYLRGYTDAVKEIEAAVKADRSF